MIFVAVVLFKLNEPLVRFQPCDHWPCLFRLDLVITLFGIRLDLVITLFGIRLDLVITLCGIRLDLVITLCGNENIHQ